MNICEGELVLLEYPQSTHVVEVHHVEGEKWKDNIKIQGKSIYIHWSNTHRNKYKSIVRSRDRIDKSGLEMFYKYESIKKVSHEEVEDIIMAGMI